jgi:ubiquinone/menaquinone biosynthesis methyltransferase
MPPPSNPPPLARAFTSPDVKRQYVRRLFATIADRYDFITGLLSFGRDRGWKRRLIDLAGVSAGWRVLDLACGTGDIAFESVRRGATTVGLDITLRMVELAKQRPEATRQSTWLVGDMTALPVAASAFDAVTTGYGLRNVPDLSQAIAEIHRVLRPGGRAACWRRSTSTGRMLRGCARSISAISRSSAPRSGGSCTAIPTPIATFRRPSGGLRGAAASRVSWPRPDSTTCGTCPSSAA